MKLPTFKIGGIHPKEEKYASAADIKICPLPMTVDILLKQHAGAEAKPIVSKGDHVNRGQKIGEAVGFISAPVHTSISGTVTAIGPVRTAQGRIATAITIKASPEDHEKDQQTRYSFRKEILSVVKDYKRFTPEEIKAVVANAGIVGLGGATFPTAVKFSPPPGKKADVLIINACECEPRLTCDDALMRMHSMEIMEGIELIMKAADVNRAIIGIEANKPEAYTAMSAAASKYEGITVQQLQTKYPQGGEKQLIYALLGKEVPSGGLPISVGAIVNNVATAFAVYCAVVMRIPVIERVVTIANFGNYLAAIGTKICDVPFDIAPEDMETLKKADVVAGGPMMGQSIVTVDAPVTKGFSGLSIFKPLGFNPQPCIRCGECATACPMGLQPYAIATCSRMGKYEEAGKYGAMDCIECGSCNYSCPSARPIVDYIRLSKMKLRSLKQK